MFPLPTASNPGRYADDRPRSGERHGARSSRPRAYRAHALTTPATASTPVYLVTPAVQGAHGLRWDNLNGVTPRMQRIMTAALKKGTVGTHAGGSATFPTDWAVGGRAAAGRVGCRLRGLHCAHVVA